MTIIQTNEFRAGMKVIIENNLCEIIEHQFHKPGKGQAVMRVKYKNLITSQVLDKTFKTGESIEKANIEITRMQFLYSEEKDLVFMNSNTFEQINIEKSLIEEKIKWMKEGEEYEISMWEEKIVNVEIQNFIEIEIFETEPGFKGDTSTNTLKEAMLSNGIEIKVPLFIEVGDVVKVDTRSCEYQNRVNK
tara:strand:+ start:283 stop:852 length:570 start_codon:yes stop_codon:yes gene_type:complete